MAAVAVQVGPPPNHGALDGDPTVAPTLSHNDFHRELDSTGHRERTVDSPLVYRGGHRDSL